MEHSKNQDNRPQDLVKELVERLDGFTLGTQEWELIKNFISKALTEQREQMRKEFVERIEKHKTIIGGDQECVRLHNQDLTDLQEHYKDKEYRV